MSGPSPEPEPWPEPAPGPEPSRPELPELPERANVLGIRVSKTNYDEATRVIIRAAREQRPLGVTALAVHGVTTGLRDLEQRYRLNHLEVVTPDGQPVRWALNLIHGARLTDRVYGPNLTLRVCEAAAREKLPVYFFGSKPETLESLITRLREKYPRLEVAGSEPSRFRTLTEAEQRELAERIRRTGARITFAGLGCPRQEVFAYEMKEALSMPVLAVGAAFDFHAGLVPQAPLWMQNAGLEWFYRLKTDPRRLWKRYVLWNPVYAGLFFLQLLRLKTLSPDRARKPRESTRYG